jgi:hypothetical protein
MAELGQFMAHKSVGSSNFQAGQRAELHFGRA